MEQATRIAVSTVVEALKQTPCIKQLVFVCFNEDCFKMYQKYLARVTE